MRHGLATLSALALIAAIAPASAGAMSIRVEDGVLRYVADRGERNDSGIRQAPNGDLEVYENSTIPRDIGAGCHAGGEFGIVCSGQGVTAVNVEHRDGDDRICIVPTISVPVRYSGGTGRDTAIYCGQSVPPVHLDNDGVADDGPAGIDDVEADVEVLGGGESADTLGSGSRGASIGPGDGDDVVAGGSGPDRISAAYVEDVGTEAGSFYTRGRDTIGCGGGQDFVLADLTDTIASDCEAVGRPVRGGGSLFKGSNGDDYMGAPYGWEPARMIAKAGDDRVQPPPFGPNRIELGSGDDRVRETGGATNRVYAGPGNDFVDVREVFEATRYLDRVECGTGRDRVLADPRDKVASDCESVVRRARPPAR
ncbi:MAG TPA: hypothetical protein VF520_13965 [Thermoleophilaceae bacterium]